MENYTTFSVISKKWEMREWGIAKGCGSRKVRDIIIYRYPYSVASFAVSRNHAGRCGVSPQRG